MAQIGPHKSSVDKQLSVRRTEECEDFKIKPWVFIGPSGHMLFTPHPLDNGVYRAVDQTVTDSLNKRRDL